MDHKDLGVHTEMFSDGILPLLKCCAITNAKKKIRPGKIVSSFVLGSKDLYNFLDDNPMLGKRKLFCQSSKVQNSLACDFLK